MPFSLARSHFTHVHEEFNQFTITIIAKGNVHIKINRTDHKPTFVSTKQIFVRT